MKATSWLYSGILSIIVLLLVLIFLSPTQQSAVSTSEPVTFFSTTIEKMSLQPVEVQKIIPPLQHEFHGSGWSSKPVSEPPHSNGNNGGTGNSGSGNQNGGNGTGGNTGGNGGNPLPTNLLITPPHFKVAFIGDTALGDNYRAVLSLIRNEHTDLVLHQGDLGYDEGRTGAPQQWLNNIQTILDSTVPNGTFPYFFSKGNHDAYDWFTTAGYRDILEQRFRDLNVPFVGTAQQLGQKTSFTYQGLNVILTAPGVNEGVDPEDTPIPPTDYINFINQQLSHNNSLWTICSWHKNMRAMQVGGKGDETGWGVYEACREQGALIATAHEHSYGRTHVLSSMTNQTIADETSPYTIQLGQTIAFHSGLGGNSIRNQERCLPSTAPYGCQGEWASIYTLNQNATYGALFIEFNVDGDPRKAHGYFKNIRGEIIDEFDLYNAKQDSNVIPAEPLDFVHALDSNLIVSGQPFHFVGFNVYGLANDRAVFACGPAAQAGEVPVQYLNAFFTTMHEQGINAVRFWAFQDFTQNGTNFSSIDRVLAIAKQHQVYLIPVLENHWSDCTQGGEKSSDWYAHGYQLPYGNYQLSYQDFVRQMVTRYQNEPTILMWQLMNEAESSDATGLYQFTADMSSLVHSIDHNHLVSLGTLGTGQAGTDGENYRRLHSISTIDVVEAHDYHHETEALPLAIAQDLEIANQLHKPFFVGEAGIDANDQQARQTRANQFNAKIIALDQQGGDGYLIWQWENDAAHFGRGCDGGDCVTQEDPVLRVMHP